MANNKNNYHISKGMKWYEKDHKAIALRHFNSAQCLFANKMFFDSFYIIGYIFEMVIQFELKRIGDLGADIEDKLCPPLKKDHKNNSHYLNVRAYFEPLLQKDKANNNNQR